VLKWAFLALLFVFPAVGLPPDDPAFLTIGAGAFDFNRQKDEGVEFRIDYRSDFKIWHFKPFLTVAGVTNGMSFIGAGILLDVYFGRRFVVTPSFAPTYWRGKTNDLDLGGVPLPDRIRLPLRQPGAVGRCHFAFVERVNLRHQPGDGIDSGQLLHSARQALQPLISFVTLALKGVMDADADSPSGARSSVG